MKKALAILGLKGKGNDAGNFLIGLLLPPLLLLLLFFGLKNNGMLGDSSYCALLLSGKRKLVYYLLVGCGEEIIFRGLVFGLLGKKINNITVSILLSAAIFAIPHAINPNAPLYVMLLFAFSFGLLACEMRCLTKSIWMSTGFHWTWNYSIASVFMATNTNQYIYRWITLEILVLTLLFYVLRKRRA